MNMVYSLPVFGALSFIMWMLPSSMTAKWFGVSNDTMFIYEGLEFITFILCIGFFGIIKSIQNK